MSSSTAQTHHIGEHMLKYSGYLASYSPVLVQVRRSVQEELEKAER